MKTVSIRTSLLRNFLLLILSVSVIILITQTYGARRTVRDLSQQLIAQSTARAEEAMRHFFGSVETLLSSSQSWWNSGLLTYNTQKDLKHLNAIFIPLLDQYSYLTSMMLAHDQGFEYLLFRDPRGGETYQWYNRIVWADKGPDAGFEALWTRDLNLYRQGTLPEEARGYDPRKRPFYREPEFDVMYWTDPYYFFITKDAGVTAAFKWKDLTSGQTRLVAFDLMLTDLSHFTSELHPSPNSRVFVMHPDGSILGLPADKRWPDIASMREVLQRQVRINDTAPTADQAAFLRTAKELDLPAVQEAIEAWRGMRPGQGKLFEYSAGGKSWWAGFRPFVLQNQQLWIGVVIPEEDFMQGVIQQRNVVLLICVGALLAAVGMTNFLARRYSRPLETLAEQSARIRQLNLTDKVPVTSSIREVAQLANAQSQMIAALDSFSRYVPLDLVRELLRRGEVAQIGGRTANLTILFTDIQDFTRLAERMPPDALTRHMAEYFGVMLEILHANRATVDKFVGDAIVAFWGAPDPDVEHAVHAIGAVLRCREILNERNQIWEQGGLPPLHTRFGLCTGDAVVGNVGAPTRLNYTVLGDTANTASRLEALNGYYGTWVLASETVVAAAGDTISWRTIDRVAVKGKGEALTIYEPLGETRDVSEIVLERARRYETALHLYTDGRFEEAFRILVKLLSEFPADGASRRLHDLCLRYQTTPPEHPWDGITRYESK
ncbi:MAG: adenylate/guanylate cyclase domain-containing protein [Nitrospirales bacterium]|nr:adenylate/guanylate cyclase domain-containing protein [Nitrospirales bacterium]